MIIVKEKAIKLFNLSLETKVPIKDMIVKTISAIAPCKNDVKATPKQKIMPIIPPIK